MIRISQKIIIEHMKKVKQASMNAHCPHVNLLIKVLKYLNIALENEECFKYEEIVIDKDTIESLV